MALADQLKALLQSHSEGDDAQFYSIAMQLAAHEAKVGHGKLAKELRELIDQAKSVSSYNKKPVLITRPRGELSELLSASYPKLNLSDIVLSAEIEERLNRLVKEHREIRNLRSYGLSPRRRILLVGPLLVLAKPSLHRQSLESWGYHCSLFGLIALLLNSWGKLPQNYDWSLMRSPKREASIYLMSLIALVLKEV